MMRMVLSGIAALGIWGNPGAGGVSDAGEEDFPEAIVRWEPIAANPLFEGAGGVAWDSKIRERGWIVPMDDGTYRLYYTGYNEARSPATRSLGLATSPDGLNWTRHPENPIHDSSWVEDMCVVRHEGAWWMFAEGEGDVAHLLISEDGIDWEERGPLDVREVDGDPIRSGPYGTPAVLVVDGRWHLFYERGDQGVWLATSTDAEVWTNVSDMPVIAMGPEPYDRAAVALNQVVERDGVYYGIYHANAQRPWRDWTTCVARSTDLRHWEKYPGNPIVGDNASSGILVETPEGAVLFTMHPEVRRYAQTPRVAGDEAKHDDAP